MVNVTVDIASSTLADIQYQIYKKPQGFRGLLIGHVVGSHQKLQTDSQTNVITNHLHMSITATLVLDRLFEGYRLDKNRLVRTVTKIIPKEHSGLTAIGLVQYSPWSDSPSVKAIHLTAHLHDLDQKKEKILLHIFSSKTDQDISYSSKAFLLSRGGEWNPVNLQVLDLGQIPAPLYMSPSPNPAIAGNILSSVTKDQTAALDREFQNSKLYLQDLTNQLFDTLNTNNSKENAS